MGKIKSMVIKYRLPVLIIGAGIILMIACTFLDREQENASAGNTFLNQSSSANVNTREETLKNDFEAYADYEERRLEGIWSEIEDVGRLRVAVYVNATPSGDSKGMLFPEIKGVLVFAEGAQRASVKEKIVKSVAALYGLPLSMISVLW